MVELVIGAPEGFVEYPSADIASDAVVKHKLTYKPETPHASGSEE